MGHVVALDGKVLKTPGKAALVLPTRALADAVAEEWRAQTGEIDPETMPQTQFASTAIDRVMPQHSSVVAEVANFADTDLLCYRADEPDELVAKQARVWDPYLKWVQDALGAELRPTAGVMPAAQDPAALSKINAAIDAFDAFSLTAAHALTNGLGSVVLALAYLRDFAPLEAVWQASILDATYQERAWGVDDEAAEKRAKVHFELTAAAEFISHLRNK